MNVELKKHITNDCPSNKAQLISSVSFQTVYGVTCCTPQLSARSTSSRVGIFHYFFKQHLTNLACCHYNTVGKKKVYYHEINEVR